MAAGPGQNPGKIDRSTAGAAAVRRHAVYWTGECGDIPKQINDITEDDAIVTWLDLIMCAQYGPRGFRGWRA
jgi:hypothetical protein